MDRFTPFASTLGGLLIGLSASALLYFNGRIAGISGVLGSAIAPKDGVRSWRLLFLIGLVFGGAGLWFIHPSSFDAPRDISLGRLAIAGLLVGFGTRLGEGCTSGHGICGIARLSSRSIAATCAFLASGAAAVFVMRHL